MNKDQLKGLSPKGLAKGVLVVPVPDACGSLGGGSIGCDCICREME